MFILDRDNQSNHKIQDEMIILFIKEKTYLNPSGSVWKSNCPLPFFSHHELTVNKQSFGKLSSISLVTPRPD